MEKAQAEIVSTTLIILIILVFIGIAYTWLYPLMERKQAEMKVERLLTDFTPANPKSLPRKIDDVAKEGGEVSFRISSDGIWKLYPHNYAGPENNSIEFSTFSKAVIGKITIGKWKSLIERVSCPPSKGSIAESPYAVCVKADPYADGYNVIYRVTFRELEESPVRGSKINLERWTDISPTTSTSRDIKIKRANIYPKLVDEKTLIIREIKISLV